MTSWELVQNTMNFKNYHDRAPRDLWDLPWAERYEAEGLKHIRDSFKMDYSGPRTVYREQSSVKQGVAHEIGKCVDEWGCIWTNLQYGVVGEIKDPLVTDDDWEDTSRVVFPEELLSFDIEQVNASCAEKHERYLYSGYGVRPFERLQFIRGTANLYMDLTDPPPKMLEFMEKLHDFYCRLMLKWAQTDVDCLMMLDDWGSQRSLLISPEMWRKYFKPMYRDYIDIAHKHGKTIRMHSDGYILDIIPDLIDMGLDTLNAQLFCMGVENLAQFKGKITFYGEICRQKLLPFASVEEVRNAVRSVFDNLWDNGGCIAQCEFGPAAKPENVFAVFDTWDQLTAGR